MNKMLVAILLVLLSPAYADADELVLGYITDIRPESKQALQKRHEIIAMRRGGIPLLVHRGATKEAPENTLEAYAAAMDLGADGVEIDIRRSKDGVLYLFHDDTLDRETNGSGKVKDVTYYELLKLAPKRIYGRANKNTRPPTLAALFVLARQRAMLLHLDIKEAGIQNELANMLDKMDMWDHIVEVNAYNADRLRPPADSNNRDPDAPYNKVRLMPYKGWTPTWDGPDEEIIKAIRKWLPTKPGKQMAFCKDPRLPAKAMGKKPHKPSTIPENLRAWWGPKGIVKTASAGIVSVGKFAKIYDPSVGMKKKWYINDHCFVRGKDGTWHLFGITHAEPMNPLDEDNLAHATAKELNQVQWKKQPFALSVDPKWKEEHLWAPHVVLHKGTYYMYYCAGDKDHTKYKIHLATSKDLWSWKRHPKNPMVVAGYDARDPFILKVGKKWVMYYTATSEPKGGNHIVACQSSSDLIHWQEPKTVFLDPSKGTYGGPTESPFVVRRGPYYYLFIGPRGGYVGTAIYRSEDPFKWRPEGKVSHFNSHAAEVVRDEEGNWFVSHCGWGKGGVFLAPLKWNDGLNNAKTSLQPGH